MSPDAYNPAARRALLAMVMLALLAVSVGGAWWLQHRAAGGLVGGQAVLDEIRRRGVGAFFDTDGSLHWMLGYESGPSPVRWRVEMVHADGDVLVGRVIEELPRERLNIQETWRLNADATVGDYQSFVTRPNGRVTAQTGINLGDGKVTVQQQYPRFRGIARAEAPANYLPEGTIPAAVRVIADQQTRAQFRLILNDTDHTRGVRFSNMTLEYVGAGRTGEGLSIRRVRMTGGGIDSVYELDPSGRIVGLREGRLRWLAADEADVRAAFPALPETRAISEPPTAEEEGGEF